MCNKDTVDNKVHIHKKLRNNHRDGKCKQCTIRNRLFKITQGTSPYIFLYLIVSQKNDKKAIFCRVISIYVFHIAAISCRELPFFRQFRFFSNCRRPPLQSGDFKIFPRAYGNTRSFITYHQFMRIMFQFILS